MMPHRPDPQWPAAREGEALGRIVAALTAHHYGGDGDAITQALALPDDVDDTTRDLVWVLLARLYDTTLTALAEGGPHTPKVHQAAEQYLRALGLQAHRLRHEYQ